MLSLDDAAIYEELAFEAGASALVTLQEMTEPLLPAICRALGDGTA